MAITKSLNSKANIKQNSDADFPIQPRFPVIARYSAVSTASQTIINLPWTVDTINAQDSFFISIDGKVLTFGASNDYTMTATDSLGFSGQVTLTQSLITGLNIQAWKMALKKELTIPKGNRNVVFRYASYPVPTTDEVIVGDSTSGNLIFTLPTVVGNDGKEFTIYKQVAANKITLAAQAGQTIDFESIQELLTITTSVTLVSDGVSNWMIT